jgi:hypothetical protein
MGCGGPAALGLSPMKQCNFLFKLIFQGDSNLQQSKRYLLELRKIQIKYGREGFEVRNTFPYRNFSRFKRNFELKLKKDSRV